MAALAEEQTEVAVKLEPEGPPTLLPPQAGDGTGEGGGGTPNNGPSGGGGSVAAASSASGDGGTPKPAVAVPAAAPAPAAAVSEAGASHDRQTLLAVLQFLRQSNLREAEEALRREARLLEEAAAGSGAPGEPDGAEAASALLSRVSASAPGPVVPDPPGTGALGAAAVSGSASGSSAPGKGEPGYPGSGAGSEESQPGSQGLAGRRLCGLVLNFLGPPLGPHARPFRWCAGCAVKPSLELSVPTRGRAELWAEGWKGGEFRVLLPFLLGFED